jgi:hypothetical protein
VTTGIFIIMYLFLYDAWPVLKDVINNSAGAVHLFEA